MEREVPIALFRSEPHKYHTFIKVFTNELIDSTIARLRERAEDFDPLIFGKIPMSACDTRKEGNVHHEIVARGLYFHPQVNFKVYPSMDGKYMVWRLPKEYPHDEDFVANARYLLAMASPMGAWSSPVTIHYVHMCVFLANKRVHEDIKRLIEDFQQLKYLNSLHPEEVKFFMRESIWEKAMSLLGDYFKLPNFLEPRFDKPISDWLVTETEDKSPFLSHGERSQDNIAFEAKILRDLEENLKGPFEALGKALGQVGIFLPEIPQVTLQSPKIKIHRWRLLIEEEARNFYASYFLEETSYKYARALKDSTCKALGLMRNAIDGLVEPRMHFLRSGVGGVDRVVEFWRKGMMTNHPRTWSFFL